MDALFEVGTQTFIREDIDFSVEEGFEFLAEFDQIQQAAPAVHFDQQAGPASPRATDPKTRTLRAPCRAASRTISLRLDFSISVVVMVSVRLPQTEYPFAYLLTRVEP
jgi:hypothetical protein